LPRNAPLLPGVLVKLLFVSHRRGYRRTDNRFVTGINTRPFPDNLIHTGLDLGEFESVAVATLALKSVSVMALSP
jgi:hypothetical protein